MDFAKELIKKESVISKSGVCILPVPEIADEGDKGNEEDDSSTTSTNAVKRKVNRMLVQSANNAATDLFLSSGSKIYSTFKKSTKIKASKQENDEIPTSKDQSTQQTQDQQKVDCKLYPTQLLPSSSKIEPSSLVVIFESFDSLNFVYATPKAIFNNRNGAFHHDDFIGKPFGCKIRSRSHRGLGFVYLLKPTPELWARSLNHRTQIVHELDASMIVFHLNLKPNMVVCESGTGSGAMSHAIIRAVAPFGTLHTYEFNQMRVKTAREEFKSNGVDHLVNVHWRDVCGKPRSKNETEKIEEEEIMGSGGFNIGKSVADAIFLDLPEPWLAIEYAAETLKPNGRLCSYSPCVEQSQKTVQAMTSIGFHSIRTLEVRLREHYVDEVTKERVPTDKLPKVPNVNPFVPGAPSPPPENKEETTIPVGAKTDHNIKDESSNTVDDDGISDGNCSISGEKAKKRKILCARPFAKMKGHTAFLTFANSGNVL